MPDDKASEFIMSEPDAAQALSLFTNRLLLDFISIQVDTGQMTREVAASLMRFSANEVIGAAPHLRDAVTFFAELSVARLPGGED